MSAKEQAKEKISALIEKYEIIAKAGKLKDFNEANTRKDFIIPLFEALGWDVRNSYEVAEEENVSNGIVDYAFKLNGTTKFYLEAKQISVDLEEERWARQTIDYAWYKSVAWAVLSDFEGIKIFNAEWREDNVDKNLFIDLKHADYLGRFEDLWLLSKESLENGLLEKKAEQYGKRAKRRPVNEVIFDDLIVWRKSLLDDLNKLNQTIPLSSEEKEEVVQKILDRLIFIRSCEDRKIENERLRAALRDWEEKDKKGELYDKVVALFEYYHFYDTTLFSPGHPCEKVNIFNGTIASIINGLYRNAREKIDYDFKTLPADVLGGIYEQYLGHILKRGKLVEGKPHRKEQGIYYTPKYIVDYIVGNTLGKLLEEIPREKAGLIKILDPACGSGSFLIKALDVMDKYYEKDPENKKFPYSRRVKALHNNIYGVDLDEKAVEIAQLNLMLRALAERRALPNISSNIKCGNSLISGTPEELKKYFGANWRDKKPFNWEEQFPDVFKQGGFDVIIGNPPYIQLSMDPKLEEGYKNYLLTAFHSSMGRLNTFGFFIKLGIMRLKEGGRLSFIVPNTILTQDYYEELRKMILDSCSIENILSFDNLPFKDAVVENVVLILRKTAADNERDNNNVINNCFNESGEIIIKTEIKQSFFRSNHKFAFILNAEKDVLSLRNKILNDSRPLGDFLEINQAIALKHERAKYLSGDKDGPDYKPILDGRYINRYTINWNHAYLKYDINAIHSCKREDIFLSKEKLFFRRVGDRLIAAFDDNQFYALNTLIVMNLKKGANNDLKYYLALFNSKLINYYYSTFLKSTKKVFSEIQTRQVAQLPIKPINPSIVGQKESHNKLVLLSKQMINLNKQLKATPENSNNWLQLKEEIAKTDKQIDAEVYKLYGLTEEEIKVVEGEK
ncbi:MAG: N-6 DNA methylase [Candidatus Margulisbacteria bacterium]|nr:N-6 DNA methylase [Candidatus Margulisiibacteriota bacterium]